MVGKGPTKKGSKKQTVKFTVDCSQPVEDSVLEPANFEKFLKDSIKVNGKAGNLGDTISVSRDKTKVIVSAELPLAKRYLKYLTKKFLKRQQLRDSLHVIATNKVRTKRARVVLPRARAPGERGGA